MSPALRAFLHGLIDYAGLFPPARLDLDPALHHYARYRQSADAWMLSRFIIPAPRLGELDAYAARFAEPPPFVFSILGHPADGDLFGAMRQTLADARAFEVRHAGNVAADLFEFKLPTHITEDASALGELFEAADEGLRLRAGEPAHGFFEVPLLGDDWRCGVDTVADVAAAHNANAGRPSVGLKLRCGGVTPDAFPTPEALACAIAACHEAGVPFKATAGLHHPVRHYADEVGAMMHGFLNVFGAAILTRAHALDRATIERMLLDEQPDHFIFDDDCFRWTDLGVMPDEIAEARSQFATSYGSCSFIEPREDLQALGLLDAVAV
ncbi:MAG: hypothetical protein HKN04_11410 [Rhodothermaceae bacterium]|nr:hypothetical protein [Rhodothermaceae bacterium]